MLNNHFFILDADLKHELFLHPVPSGTFEKRFLEPIMHYQFMNNTQTSIPRNAFIACERLFFYNYFNYTLAYLKQSIVLTNYSGQLLQTENIWTEHNLNKTIVSPIVPICKTLLYQLIRLSWFRPLCLVGGFVIHGK